MTRLMKTALFAICFFPQAYFIYLCTKTLMQGCPAEAKLGWVIVAGLVYVLGLVFCITEVSHNIKNPRKLIWVISLVVFGYLTIPLYWLLQIMTRKEPVPEGIEMADRDTK